MKPISAVTATLQRIEHEPTGAWGVRVHRGTRHSEGEAWQRGRLPWGGANPVKDGSQISSVMYGRLHGSLSLQNHSVKVNRKGRNSALKMNWLLNLEISQGDPEWWAGPERVEGSPVPGPLGLSQLGVHICPWFHRWCLVACPPLVLNGGSHLTREEDRFQLSLREKSGPGRDGFSLLAKGAVGQDFKGSLGDGHVAGGAWGYRQWWGQAPCLY